MTTKGLKKSQQQLKEISQVNMEQAIVKGLEILKQYSMQNAPVKTGFLRDSHEIVGTELRVNAEYAAAVEYGTVNMAAQPYLRPALDEHQDEISKAIQEDIQRQIRGIL